MIKLPESGGLLEGQRKMTIGAGSKQANVEWGRPLIDEALCTACGCCADVCLSLGIAMKDGKPLVVTDDVIGCLACGHCMAVCPFQAIRITGRGMTGEDRLPLAPPSDRAGADALEALLRARRSIRRYKDRPVERPVIDRLLGMASTAPMGFPPSPVGVAVINGKEKVQELAGDVTNALRKWLFLGTPLGAVMLAFMMDKTMAGIMKNFVLPVTGKILEARRENRDLLFYDAPCVVLFHYPMKDTIDPTIACSFATLAAESLGLGSCIIGTVPPALQGSKKLKSKWGIPEKNVPSIAMTLGYPAIRFASGIRRRFASVEYI